MLVIRQTVSDGIECEPDLSEAKSSSYHMTQPREVNSEKTLLCPMQGTLLFKMVVFVMNTLLWPTGHNHLVRGE